MPRPRTPHEALAGRRDERDRLGKENAHRIAERDRLRVGRAVDLIWPSAAAVSSTAVFSVSVANCSRWASCTLSACFSANSRSAPRRSSGSPPKGRSRRLALHAVHCRGGPASPSAQPARCPLRRDGIAVAGLDLALELRHGRLRRPHRRRERRSRGGIELALEPARRRADLVEPRGRRELRRLPDDGPEARGRRPRRRRSPAAPRARAAPRGCATSSSRSPPPAASAATSHSAAIDTASRSSALSVTAYPSSRTASQLR